MSSQTRDSLEWSVRAVWSGVELGDTRRTDRLVGMATAACERPSGRVTAVFTTDAQREGAYDFLESEHVCPEEMVVGLTSATVRRCAGLPFVFVPIDGTSVTVTD